MANVLYEPTDFIIVAAIDFGTTFSGYAFSFKTSKEEIKMNKNWGSNVGFQSYKTPTCVLLNPQGEFDSFGYEAEVKYGEEVEKEEDVEQCQWNMFRHFKMALHCEKNVQRSITSVSGQIMPALDIFAMALRYLKKHLMDAVNAQVVNHPDDSMFRWVITVPAIWSDESKHFMREAAFKAGYINSIGSKQLVIALEPEAASISCRRLQIDGFRDRHGGQIQFQPGVKYLVIDCGGGTVDVTAHEVVLGGGVRELHQATGGAWGGTKVDQKYEELLSRILSPRFINEYKSNCPQQWFKMMTDFERLKRSAKPDARSGMNIPLSWSLGTKYMEIMGGRSVEQTIGEARSMGVTFANGAMIINNNLVKEMFEPVVNNIVSHIDTLMEIPAVKQCQYFFMVGGFSESAYLQQAIRDRFEGDGYEILVPNEAQMSVIKGAVLFGHNPDDVRSRMARKTYGYSHLATFDPSTHKRAKLVVRENVELCEDIFGAFVRKNDEVGIGEKRTSMHNPVEADQRGMDIEFFCHSERLEGMNYTDDPGMQKLCTLHIDMPDTTGGRDRKVKLQITFGGTEIQAEAHDITTGNQTKTSFNFQAGK